MNLSVEVDVPQDVSDLSIIELSKLNAQIHKGNTTGHYPVEIVTDDEALKGVVHSIIRCCMRESGEGAQVTPWSKVDQRLMQYHLDHLAFIHLQPSNKIDIRIL